MNRIIITDKESDALIKMGINTYRLPVGNFFNKAVKNEFLPITEPFRTEARFLLQQHAKNKLDDCTIKQSMSRGIRALATRPIHNPTQLLCFFEHYHLYEAPEQSIITAEDSLWTSATEVYDLLDKQRPTSGTRKIDGAYLVDDIFDAWETLWNKKPVYDVLATLAFRCEPNPPFQWFDGITFLSAIEREALHQWSYGRA